MLSHRLTFFTLVCICGKWALLCQFLHVFLYPGTCRKVSCTLSWSIPAYLYQLSLCIQITLLYFCSRFGLTLVPLWLFLIWGLCKRSSLCLCVFLSFHHVHLKYFLYTFEICHMVDSLSAWSGIIFVFPGSFHLDIKFWYFSHFWD